MLADATTSTASVGSTDNGTMNVAGDKPGLLAVTVIVFGAADAGPCKIFEDRGAAPESALTVARRARSASVPEAF